MNLYCQIKWYTYYHGTIHLQGRKMSQEGSSKFGQVWEMWIVDTYRLPKLPIRTNLFSAWIKISNKGSIPFLIFTICFCIIYVKLSVTGVNKYNYVQLQFFRNVFPKHFGNLFQASWGLPLACIFEKSPLGHVSSDKISRENFRTAENRRIRVWPRWVQEANG